MLKHTCAAQETHESAYLIPSFEILKFPRSQSSYTQKKKIEKNQEHILRTIRSPFLVLTFQTFVLENRTVLVTISTDELVGAKLIMKKKIVHEKAAIDGVTN